MSRRLIISVYLTLCLTSPLAGAKNIQYVSDELTIPMRTGTTTNHKILKFLTSGAAVEVLEVSADQRHARISLVESPERTGWVETRLLKRIPSAREQLKQVKKKNQKLKEQQADLKRQLSELKQTHAGLQKQQDQLQQKNQDLLDTLNGLRKSAAEPLRISEENTQLKQQLGEQKSKNDSLIKENAFLADQNIKQWFMIGAAVSLGSLILGLLITRINWKRRDSWAGSF